MNRINQLTSHLTYPNGLLHNQTTLITGGGQGIGAEIARLFAKEGARVVIADIDHGRVPVALSSYYILLWGRKAKNKYAQKKQHPPRSRSRRAAAKPSPWSAIS